MSQLLPVDAAILPYNRRQMTAKILASVGRLSVNRNPDVKLVQELLNGAGASPPLKVDGQSGPKTVGAIVAFQKRNFSFADGRVDPGGKTINALSQSGTGGGAKKSQPQGKPGGAGTGVAGTKPSGLRGKIIAIAQQQATPPPGKVSDLVTMTDPVSGKRVRAGWKLLQEFFDVAVSGWSPNHWKDPKILAGVQIPGRRIPQPGTSGVSWCGIFATWVLIKAGMPVKWGLGKGINLPIKADQGFRAGDVCIKKGDRVHHFIPITDTDPMQTVNGNSDSQSILIKPIYRSQVAYYYQVD